MNRTLLYIATGLAFAAALCCYWGNASAWSKSLVAQDRVHRCRELEQEILLLQGQNANAVKIAESDYDPSSEIRDLTQKAGLVFSAFEVDQTRLRLLDNTDVREWEVAIPQTQYSILQLSGFIQSLAESPAGFQVKSVSLKAASSEARENEQWIADLKISYLKRDN